MYPIRFEPLYQSYVWGGDRILKKFNRSLSSGVCAESWEIADRNEGVSRIANGPWMGYDLNALVVALQERLLGTGRFSERFPLLVKLLDAKENLSVQVHPDEKVASLLGGEPKTESWVVLEHGIVYAGLQQGTTQDCFQKALKEGNPESLLQKISVEAGDAMYIPAGRIHAIGSGCLLLEVQQNSNTTYRLYDWGRVGRDLHFEKAFASVHWQDQTSAVAAPWRISADEHHILEGLIRSLYFLIDRIQIIDRWNIPINPNTFQIFFFLSGEGTIQVDQTVEPFSLGSTYLVPAASQFIGIEGRCQIIRICLS